MTLQRPARSRRNLIVGAVFAIVAATSVSALAYRPWQQSTLITHYDEYGFPVGIESVGDYCGFPLIGTTGVTTSEQAYQCDENVLIPF
ncbi:MAG: hypothetical protein IT473_02505 [Lysobacter sp.]|nr:hypothetical protein [Lysobacter sp.]